MEYHEIGERFEYDGVVLEVVNKFVCDKCKLCFFSWGCELQYAMNCSEDIRQDGESIYYKLVEQCKTKENNNMDKKIYYADLTPCDNMDDYKEAAFVPQFVLDDTKKFDTKPPIGVVQLATRLGWCIVVKWFNNGSTRIYALEVETVKEGVEILHGLCDSGDCDYAFGEEKIYVKYISEEDMSVFYGYTT